MNAEPQHPRLIGAARRAEVWEIREFPAKPPGCEIWSMPASELHAVKAFTHRMQFFCLMSNLHKQLNLNFELMTGHEYLHTECDHRCEKVWSHCVIFQLEEDFFSSFCTANKRIIQLQWPRGNGHHVLLPPWHEQPWLSGCCFRNSNDKNSNLTGNTWQSIFEQLG